ncbi:hypothetical protein SAMN05216323_100365 [Williamwhitmania taraxaci]|uniref:Type IX secretion system protein PorV domain-containing protein n=2 Tax=Williamwhitmania taraxaci TaxID=1640674 RepID=A0A1G6GRK3_9BACT|nr:hypothetical protein SAMN05216323_100365 [Williamwhitmania taraxaci]
MIKKPIILLALVFLSIGLDAQTISKGDLGGGINSIQTAVPFLTIAPDSRGGSMGDLGAATTPDVNSQFWNPAKYAFMESEVGVSLTYTPWLRNLINDINLTYLAGYYRFRPDQTISASLRYFSFGDITFTGGSGNTVKKFKPNEFSFDVGYSRLFGKKISGAIAFRYIRSDLTGGYSNSGASSAGQAFAADIAAYYQQPIMIADKKGEMAFGANISNIGTKLSYNEDQKKDFIPMNFRLGGRATAFLDQYNKISVALDFNKLLVPTPPIYDIDGNIVKGKNNNISVTKALFQSFYDAPDGFSEEVKEIAYSIGAEYTYANQFSVRSGYFHESEMKGNRKYYSVGAGVKYNYFNLDFAYLIPASGRNNPMANTVRFTLTFQMESGNSNRR